VRDERCCLLCYEEDFNFCHRSFVAEKVAGLLDEDVKINHLTGPMSGRVVWRRLARIFHRGIEQRSGERVRRLEITQPNENATHRFFDYRL